MLRFVRDLMIIRRVEFLPVELTIFFIPLLVQARHYSDLASRTVVEGALIFFVLFSLGDIVNCLSDRDLDVLYKRRLSDAVRRLGVPLVRALVIACAVIALGVGLHLSAVTGNFWLLALIGFGMFLGIEYSTGPFHFKSRGIGHLACLWLLLYFLPMLYAGMLVDERLATAVVLLAGSYATAEMGVILINTSEDLPEDLACGIRTTTVSLGLSRTLVLALTMVAVGGAVFATQWALLLAGDGWTGATITALTGLIAALLVVLAGMARLTWGVHRAESAAEAIARVKARGAWVPVWALAIGFGGLACAFVHLSARTA